VEDSEIVAAIAAGDPAGLPAAYDKYAAGVYAYCRWMLQEPAYAADALVETFVAAATELGALRDAIAARALLYTVARAECHRQLATAGQVAADTSADQTVFRNPEREASELSLRHGLSEAELAAVLDVPWQEAHNLAAHARDHQEPPTMALLDRVPPQLRDQVLLRAGVSAAPGSLDTGVAAVGSGWPGWLQWIGKLGVWRPIRANPGGAIATGAVAAWVATAASTIAITLTGMHAALPLATQSHPGRTTAASQSISRRVPPSATASPSPSAGPSSRSVLPVTARPSPARSPARPSPTTQPAQSPPASPSASISPSPTPSPSATASPSPTPS
jgi:DNA-directed RNA polymerase specialized sigma24 family protein